MPISFDTDSHDDDLYYDESDILEYQDSDEYESAEYGLARNQEHFYAPSSLELYADEDESGEFSSVFELTKAPPPLVIAGTAQFAFTGRLPKRRLRPFGWHFLTIFVTITVIFSAFISMQPLTANQQIIGYSNSFMGLANLIALPVNHPFEPYRVPGGETFLSLSQQMGVQLGGIYEANHFLANAQLQAGQEILIPTDPEYGANYYPPLPMVGAYIGYNLFNKEKTLGDHIALLSTQLAADIYGYSSNYFNTQTTPPIVQQVWDNPAWGNGNVQCVAFVDGAYKYAGITLPTTPNAVNFWGAYSFLPGYAEIANGQGLPAPGDIIVMSGGQQGFGHVAVVVYVEPPVGNNYGAMVIAQSNSPSSLAIMIITPSGYVESWPFEPVIGFIRPQG